MITGQLYSTCDLRGTILLFLGFNDPYYNGHPRSPFPLLYHDRDRSSEFAPRCIGYGPAHDNIQQE
jgi:hypothetical protein